MSKKPKVSVCIPTYNRAQILQKVIQSVLSQTYKDYELFISDDASPDNTEEMVKNFGDARIRYHKNKDNLGIKDNWNFVIKNAIGEYVFKLDDDDYVAPTFLEKTIALFEKHPNVGLVYTGFYYTKDYDGGWIEKVVDKTLFKGEYIGGIDYVKAYLLHTSIAGLHHSSAVFRYRLAKEIGFYEKVKNDTMFSLALASKSDVGYVPEPLFYYVQHHKARATYAQGKSPNLGRPKFVEEFFDIDFIKKNGDLMKIKELVLKRERKVRSILHLLMSRKAFTLKDYLKLTLALIKEDKKLLLSPLFVSSCILTLLMPQKIAEKFSYMYKSKPIFIKLNRIIFGKK